MNAELKPKSSPAETLIANLARRGVTLHTDGVRIWPTPKASLHTDEAAAVDKLYGELVAILAPPAAN